MQSIFPRPAVDGNIRRGQGCSDLGQPWNWRTSSSAVREEGAKGTNLHGNFRVHANFVSVNFLCAERVAEGWNFDLSSTGVCMKDARFDGPQAISRAVTTQPSAKSRPGFSELRECVDERRGERQWRAMCE